jgi:Sigma-70, region 4
VKRRPPHRRPADRSAAHDTSTARSDPAPSPLSNTAAAQPLVGRCLECEPAVRAELRRHGLEPARIDDVVLAVFAVLLTVADADPANEVDSHDLTRLTAGVATLPAVTRQVFTLRKVYGLRAAEIAHALELSDAAVEQHLITAARACARALFDPSASDSEIRPGDPT